MKNIKHYIIPNDSEYQKMICELLIDDRRSKFVRYVFLPNKDDSENGVYEFHIDMDKYDNVFSVEELKEYEIKIINSKIWSDIYSGYMEHIDYVKNKKEKERIEKEEFDKKLSTERELLYERTLDEAKEEIKMMAETRYNSLMEAFKKTPSYQDIYDMFKDNIEIEVYMRTRTLMLEIMEKFRNSVRDSINYITLNERNEVKKIFNTLLSSFKYNIEYGTFNNDCIDFYEESIVEKNIGLLKNSIVEAIKHAFDIRRGTMEYHISERKCARIANILEKGFFDFYRYSKSYYNNKDKNIDDNVLSDVVKEINNIVCNIEELSTVENNKFFDIKYD